MFDFHRHVAATAYGIIAIASGIVLGRAAEGCDVLNTCTSRGKWVIACGVLSFVISMAAMIVSLVVRDLGKYINSAIFAFLFIWWIPGAAVTASVRSIQVPIVQGFAFLALLTAFCMMMYGLRRVFTRKPGAGKDIHASPTSADPAVATPV